MFTVILVDACQSNYYTKNTEITQVLCQHAGAKLTFHKCLDEEEAKQMVLHHNLLLNTKDNESSNNTVYADKKSEDWDVDFVKKLYSSGCLPDGF
jgi:hypothetical protein